MRYHLLSLLIYSLLFTSVAATEIKGGSPFITNYSDKDYEVSNNNHNIIQDRRGILYFANDFGILEFDGNKWTIIQVASNRSNIKSLAINDDNRIYVGAQDDFGYIDSGASNAMHYISLLDKIPTEHRIFGDVWNTIIDKDQVVFHTWKALYIYKKDSIKVIETGFKIKGVFKLRDRLIVQDENTLYELSSQGLIPLNVGEQFKNTDISFILPFAQNDALIGTYSKGIFKIKNGTAFPFLVTPNFDFNENKITSGHIRRNGHYVIGTAKSGICIINVNGKLVNHLDNENGLQNNEIRDLFSDQSDNLWVTNKKGIDFIEIASPLKRILPNSEELYGVYSSTMYHDKIFFATHNGLLSLKTNELYGFSSSGIKFKQIKNSEDINWNLNIIDDLLIVSHSNGFTQYIGDQSFPLYDGDGGWLITQMPNKPEYLIGGTYSGLVLFKKSGDRYKFISKIEGFEESSRVMEIDNNGIIWVAHGYKGIYRIQLSMDFSAISSINFYDQSKGLPSNIYNSVFKVWDKIVFGTQNGFYRYEETTDSMVINKQFTDLLGSNQGRKLQEDLIGNVWFIVGNESGIIRKHAEGSLSIEKDPFMKLNKFYIPGFENFYFFDTGSSLIGTKNGIISYNSNLHSNEQNKFNVLLRKVTKLRDEKVLYNDRLEFLCQTAVHKNPEISFKDNDLRFSFSAGFYENTEDLRYKYFLQGFDDNWSEWKQEQYKEYTNIHEGEYIFRLKAKNIYNQISDEITYKFTVLPPWYRTKWAYIGYLLIFAFLFSLYLKIRNIKTVKEKDRYIKEQIQLREIEQARFKEEKLNDELKNKNNELAGIAMKVIYKNEKLNELKERMIKIMGVASDKVANKLANVMEFINNELDDDNWDDFELRFDQTHDNFIKKLKLDFPELTAKDLKICAYLKMNLSSKEIAQLLNMTVRGVENARYRVRKRMHLEPSIHLTEWLLMRK